MALLLNPPKNPAFLSKHLHHFQNTEVAVRDFLFDSRAVLKTCGLLGSNETEEDQPPPQLLFDELTMKTMGTLIKGKPAVFKHFEGRCEVVKKQFPLHKRYIAGDVLLSSLQGVLTKREHSLPVHVLMALTKFVDPRRKTSLHLPLCTTSIGCYVPVLNRGGESVLCRLVYNPIAHHQRWTLFEEPSLRSLPPGSVITFAGIA